MEKTLRSQLLRFLLLLLLLLITPLTPSSLRSSYIYFLFNVFVVALGAEAGLLSAITGPSHEQKPPNEVSVVQSVQDGKEAEKPVVVEKKMVVSRVSMVRKSTSTPSLFFIGGSEEEEETEVAEEEEEDGGELSAQELFAKAESFIGNFYAQLKMQREESWKKIHGFYQRAF